MTSKKSKGQFYTTRASYILDDMPLQLTDAKCIIESFAGQGDLLDWIKQKNIDLPIEAYDIEPKRDDIIQCDTLQNPPDYSGAFVITNPPYLARNKSSDKSVYDLYNTNDLYKCFIISIVKGNCKGGIIIIPAGFFFSPRDIDVRCRHEFMSSYHITKIKYFEETVFNDTTTTIVAIAFTHSRENLTEQNVLWQRMPQKKEKIFTMKSADDWIIGGHIYKLPLQSKINIRRYVVGQKKKSNEQITHMTLCALDSGTNRGKICLKYDKEFVYPAKECSRTYATICISGKVLSEEDQQHLCYRFNVFLEQQRESLWSLFLPQYRESKEYARKRIPFELAYHIIHHLLDYA